MLYLAQVQRKGSEGEVLLKLLACQKAEHTWVAVKEELVPLAADSVPFGDGVLLLAEVSSDHQVQHLEDAKDWLMAIVEQYLSAGLSPAMLKEEVQRAEQWRQSLTLQSQELGRRALEMEARREQIQDLEENLKREKKSLEALHREEKSPQYQANTNS